MYMTSLSDKLRAIIQIDHNLVIHVYGLTKERIINNNLKGNQIYAQFNADSRARTYDIQL